MYHLVYKIVNQINGKYYYGVHSTTNIEDGYMGSGTLLRKEIKEFGAEYFERTIIESFESRAEAIQYEAALVTIEMLKDSNCYNLVVGGGGIRTIKSKRELFSKKAQPVKKQAPFARMHEDYQLIAKAITPYNFISSQGLDSYRAAMYEILVSPLVLDIINSLYNNKYTNHIANDLLLRIQTLRCWQGNLYVEKVAW